MLTDGRATLLFALIILRRLLIVSATLLYNLRAFTLFFTMATKENTFNIENQSAQTYTHTHTYMIDTGTQTCIDVSFLPLLYARWCLPFCSALFVCLFLMQLKAHEINFMTF